MEIVFQNVFFFLLDFYSENTFCRVEKESCRHLFFECSLSLTTFLCWIFSNSYSKNVWGAVWIAVVSELWKHKNNVIFNRCVTDVSEVFVLVQLKAWSLIIVKSHATLFFFSDWCLDPLVCLRGYFVDFFSMSLFF